MTISRRLPLLAACAVPLATGCGSDDGLQGNNASVAEAPCDDPDKLDAGADTGSELDAGTQRDASGNTPSNDASTSMNGGLDGGQVGPPDSGIRIKSVTATGSGCPRGASKVSLSPDGSILLDGNAVSYGPGKPTLQSTSCTLSLAIEAPPGVSWGVNGAEFSGVAVVDPTVKGEFVSDVALVGIGAAMGGAHKNAIAASGAFTFREEWADPPVWSRCDITSDLQLRTRLTLTASAGSTSTAEVSLQRVSKIRFVTKPCPLPAR